MAADDLGWRAEAACRDAWPCDREIARDGWLIRAAGGVTRRTNSVNPLAGARAPIASVLDEARAIYAALRRPLIVRVPDIAVGLDGDLSRLGFAPGEGETVTLQAALTGDTTHAAPVGALDDAWLAARARMIGWDAAEMAVYRRMLGLIAGPTGFASVYDDGEIAMVAYGAIAHGMLVIESVVTDAACRGRGFGRQGVAALLDWGWTQGAREACLQVTADNAPARALYRGLGFGRELYRYHYRTAP